MDEYAFINQKRWLKRTVSWSRMKRLDKENIPVGKGELRLFTVMRDEILRLPWFLDFYFNTIGVDRMFVVDNDSTDGTLDLLLADKRIHVFSTKETYVRQEAWIDALLRRYGRHGWSIVIDVDEQLVYPRQDEVDIRQLTRYLDNQGFDSMHALQLDMYAKGPIRETSYAPGEDPLKATAWFDRDSFELIQFPYRNCTPKDLTRFAGGMRKRVFKLEDVCLSKFPLLKFSPSRFLRQGTHAVEGSAVADVQAVILHYKFLHDFAPRTTYEAERGEHWNDASQYKEYARICGADPDLDLSYEGSVQYAGEQQLLDLGIMAMSSRFEAFQAE